MKDYIVTKLATLCFILIFVFVTSCKKGKNEEKTGPDYNVTLEKTDALPGDIINVTTNFSIPNLSSKIKVGSKQVDFVRIEDKKGFFIVPVIESGNTSVDFSSLKVKIIPAFTINSYKPITDPQAVIDRFKADVEKSMSVIEELRKDPVTPLRPSTYQFMVDLNTELNLTYATLTPEEKLQAAYSLQKLLFVTTDMTNLSNDKVFYQAFSSSKNTVNAISGAKLGITSLPASNPDPGDNLVKTGEKFVQSMGITVISTSIGLLALQAPEPSGLSKLVAIAAGISAGFHLAQSQVLIDKICAQFGVPSEINDPVFSASNYSIGGVNSRISSSALASASPNTSPEGFKLYNGNPTIMVLTSKFRTLTTADLVSTNNFIKSIFENEQKLNSMYTSLQNSFKKINSWFLGKVPVLPNYTAPFKASSPEKDFYLASHTISIKNVSDPLVNITSAVKDGNFVITAKSDFEATEKPISFDVIYTNTTLGTSIKKTLSGKVLAIIDSTEIYKASALGKYTVNGFVGNGPNSKLYCELKVNGVATYTIYDDPSWPNGHAFQEKWIVHKIKNEYFITTSFTNPGHLVNEARKLNYPVNSFVYRHSYVK